MSAEPPRPSPRPASPPAEAEGSLLADLGRPESYPPPRPASVDMVSTHISWVFLAGDTAWKVKRPVALGFLDFSTLAQRRQFCEEELRLNRRLAPGVYQAVLPVRRTADGHTLDPARAQEGPIVDYAVKMHRLPDDRSGAALLRAGALQPAHLAALATRLNHFYQQARPTPELGEPAVLAANVEDNLRELDRFGGSLLDPERLVAVAAAQRRDLQRHQGRLIERQRQGKVRDGHGDLRLEHVYFPRQQPEEPLVIDCLEFNERFRCADVALDIAFLAMELRAGGRSDLAEYFVQRFARESNDYELYPLLDFCSAYRALVRTKVACLLASEPGVPAEKGQRKAREAQELLALTQALESGQPERPAVVAIGGMVGAGKSTLAEALAGSTGTPVVSSDLTRKSLAGIGPTERGAPEIYAEAFTERTYAELVRRGTLVLDSGRSVILDATFRTPAQRRLARALAASRDVGFLFVETTCDDATLRDRLRARAAAPSASDADEQVLERIRQEFVAPAELPEPQRLSADSRRPLPALVQEIQDRLQGAAR